MKNIIWQALHDTITRNHQCRSMWQPLNKIDHFIETVNPFSGGKHGLAKPFSANVKKTRHT